jgi:hypothetical protein
MDTQPELGFIRIEYFSHDLNNHFDLFSRPFNSESNPESERALFV